MNSRVVLFVILLNMKFSIEENTQNIIEILPDWNKEKTDLRQRFLDKKRQNHEENSKIKLFDKINSNKTLFVAGILHLLDDDNLKNKMESSFRNVLRMNGFKTIFKRDFFWRTWREVKNESGYSSIICYKCQSIVNETCAKCRTGGYWVIEEKSPNCPYEIFSIKSEQNLCIFNYTQYLKSFNSCPSVISLRNLKLSCGNSIETKWRISKQYNVPERSAAVICQGRENCEISTLYLIQPDSIIFSIINSTNNVFYSRVMKAGNKNYICVDDCGVYDPLTKKVTKRDDLLIIDLLNNNKNKRENKPLKSLPNMTKNKFSIPLMANKELMKNGLYYEEQNHKAKELKVKDMPLKINNDLITRAHCKELQEKYLKEQEDQSYYDYV